MDKRHLLEEDHQRQALKEFNNLQSMKELVDWELFRPLLEEIFGPPRTSGPVRRPWDSLLIFRSLLLGVMNNCNTCFLTGPPSDSLRVFTARIRFQTRKRFGSIATS